MLNDIAILQQIHEELKKVDHPPFDPVVIDLYGRLVDRVPEAGLQLFLPDKEITELEDQALGILNRYHFLEVNLKQEKAEGFVWHVNLRGKRWLSRFSMSAAQQVSQYGDRTERVRFGKRRSGEGQGLVDAVSAVQHRAALRQSARD